MTLDPLYRVIGYLLALFYIPFGSLGISIILLTIVIMLVQFPLTAKQARAMIQMQRVQPEIKKIQAKYKDDKTKQNEELLKFYQENKINPLAGCLPLIVTVPIGIAVFRTFSLGLQSHLPKTGKMGELYNAICNTPDAKACGRAIARDTPEAMRFLGMSLNLSARQVSGFPEVIPYYILVGLVVLTGWYQVKQTQARQLQSGNAPPNAQMQAMTKIFPVVFGLITLTINAAATTYFVVSNVWRIGQQHLVIGKLYDQAIVTGDLKPPPGKEVTPKKAADDAGGNGAKPKGKPGGSSKPASSGKAATTGKTGSTGKTGAKGTTPSGNGGSSGMTPGARRKKKRKR